jgi:hypothetical protein
MNQKTTPQSILQDIAKIQQLERGTASIIRQGPEGPYHNHQCYEHGRNVSRYVPPEQVADLKAAIDGYHQVQALMAQYVQIMVDQTRAERAAGFKKKDPAPEILFAQNEELQRLMAHFQGQTPCGPLVQELELLVRTALFQSASALVGVLLQQAADRSDAAYQSKPGERRKGRETLQVQGLFGTFPLRRDYYYHPGKKQGHYPADAALGLEVGYTPALARLICLEGADEPGYEKAERHLAETGGIAVSARQIQRVVQRVGQAAQTWQARAAQPVPCDASVLYVSGDGTGVPMCRAEVAGRKGKQPDGTAKTRQAYLGCVFTQHKTDDQGHPVRDHAATSYVSSFQPIGEFGPLLRQEAIRRGMGSAGQVVLLIDGATGLEHMGRDCFKEAVQIVDFYHALEHASLVLGALIGKDHPDFKPQRSRWAKQLLKGKVKALIAETRQAAGNTPQAEPVEKALGYFVNNVDRMQYRSFRRRGFFIGSGVVEAGCKTLIGARCKQSGMFWSKPGAENVLALRCLHASRCLDEFWKHRLNQHAKRNDALSLSA